MTQTEKFLKAVQAAGENGVATTELMKVLGSKTAQSVHSAAYALKKQKHRILNTHGTYIYKGSKQETSVVPVQPTNDISVLGVHVSQSVLSHMDAASREDLVEQLRRATLHLDIAKAIVNSHRTAEELRRKI